MPLRPLSANVPSRITLLAPPTEKPRGSRRLLKPALVEGAIALKSRPDAENSLRLRRAELSQAGA